VTGVIRLAPKPPDAAFGPVMGGAIGVLSVEEQLTDALDG
jgi:hypothetical protein